MRYDEPLDLGAIELNPRDPDPVACGIVAPLQSDALAGAIALWYPRSSGRHGRRIAQAREPMCAQRTTTVAFHPSPA